MMSGTVRACEGSAVGVIVTVAEDSNVCIFGAVYKHPEVKVPIEGLIEQLAVVVVAPLTQKEIGICGVPAMTEIAPVSAGKGVLLNPTVIG